MRSLNTSLAAVLPVLSLLVVGVELLGAVALEDFALALLIGLLAGSYSSIFVATPILAVLKERGRSGTAAPGPPAGRRRRPPAAEPTAAPARRSSRACRRRRR